jgi:septal ring factor EnvC (AmiA/AmiB activator)
VRKRTSAAEVGTIEKTLDQTVQIKKLLTEDIETLKKKLGQQGKLQSEIDQKVEEKVELVKSMGLDNPTLLDMFDKLREFKFKIEKDTMSIQNHNRSQHKQVEEKIQKLKMMIEASSAEIVRLDRDAQVINDQMVSMNKLSSLKELKTIQLIAYKERQKIASLTGNVGILSDEIDLADTQAPIYDHRAEDIANMKMYYFKKHE